MDKARSGATGEYSGAKAKARLGRLRTTGTTGTTTIHESSRVPLSPTTTALCGQPTLKVCEVKHQYPRTLSLASLARRNAPTTLLRGITSLSAAYRAVTVFSQFRSRDLASGLTTRFHSFASAFYLGKPHFTTLPIFTSHTDSASAAAHDTAQAGRPTDPPPRFRSLRLRLCRDTHHPRL
jgi:hypothetical protein